MTMHYYGARNRQQRSGGGSTGGNALSHRPDALAGYTGYTPSSMCAPLALRTKITERDPSAPLRYPAAAAPAAEGTAPDGSSGATTSTYAATFKIDPQHDYTVDPRVRAPAQGGAAASAAPSVDASCQTFSSCKSTYQAEILGRSKSIGRGGSGGGNGSNVGSASAPTSPGAGAASIAAVRPGYLTTSAANSLPIAEKFATVSLSGGSSPKVAERALSESRSSSGGSCGAAGAGAVAPPAGSRQFEGRTMYRSSYLKPGSTACSGGDSSRAASAHVAGFSGHVPAAAPELAAAAGIRPQPPKADAFLYSLDQHSRGRLPGYTGHRPQHNVSMELPAPSKLTTWGAASQEALRCPPPAAAASLPGGASHAIDSRRGLLGFFSAGSGSASEFVSENGLAEAARYHETSRPLEGRMRIPQPSKINHRGARFAG